MKKLLIVFVAFGLTIPAMAQDYLVVSRRDKIGVKRDKKAKQKFFQKSRAWNFYGNANFATFYTDFDPNTPDQDNVKNLLWHLQDSSCIGARVKLKDEIDAHFEYGSVRFLRLLYANYNFGGGNFQIGQNYSPTTSTSYSKQVVKNKNALLKSGVFYAGRMPMLQLQFGGLKLAAVTPNTSSAYDGIAEILLPKLESSYQFKTYHFFINVFGGYQTYKVKDTTAGNVHINSHVVGIGSRFNIRPIFLNAGIHKGQNYGNYGGGGRNAAIVGTKLYDVDNLGWFSVLGFKAHKILIFEAGYGIQESKLDGNTNSDKVEHRYFQTTIYITKNFFIVPEVGTIKDSSADQNGSKEFYVGTIWQINF